MLTHCTVDECPRPLFVKSRGLCQKHYGRWLRTGDATKTLRPNSDASPEERFEFYGWTEGPAQYGLSPCHLWDGPLMVNHGLFTPYAGQPKVYAHRFVYERTHGPIPEGLVVRHRCDVGRCVNPDHLETGTRTENFIDMWERKPPRRAHGEAHSKAKLSENDVRQIRDLASQGVRTYVLAKKFGVSGTNITAIVDRRIWKNVQ